MEQEPEGSLCEPKSFVRALCKQFAESICRFVGCLWSSWLPSSRPQHLLCITAVHLTRNSGLKKYVYSSVFLKQIGCFIAGKDQPTTFAYLLTPHPALSGLGETKAKTRKSPGSRYRKFSKLKGGEKGERKKNDAKAITCHQQTSA